MDEGELAKNGLSNPHCSERRRDRMSIARTISRWGFLSIVIVVLGWLVSCTAREGISETEKEQPDVIRVTVEGTNFCLGCSLKKNKGAGAQCSIFGHKHALEVTKVVAEDGKELTEMRGWVLHYLETEKSQDLIKKHHGEKLTITGKVYPRERVIEADSFK